MTRFDLNDIFDLYTANLVNMGEDKVDFNKLAV